MLHWQQQQLRHNSSSVYWNILTALNHTKHHRFELHFSTSLDVTVTDVLCCHLWPLLHIFWICSFAWKQIPTSLLGVTSMPEQLIQVWLHIPFAVIMWWNDGKFPWRVFYFLIFFYILLIYCSCQNWKCMWNTYSSTLHLRQPGVFQVNEGRWIKLHWNIGKII